MGILCDFCGEERSMVHCRSDAACLCLSCDRNVHSANALSKRHSRTLLCERCNSQPAVVRCIDEKISFCQNCDWNGHGQNTSSSGHKKQTINCYSGCPSSAELSRIWSFALEFPSVEDSNCEQAMGLMSIDENCASNYWGPQENSSTADLAAAAGKNNDLEKVDAWIGSSSMSVQDPLPPSADKPAGLVESTTPKVISSNGANALGIRGDGNFYENFSMDDAELNFGNYEELFGLSQNHSENLFDDTGIDSLFEMKNMSDANSNCLGEFVAEVLNLFKSSLVSSHHPLSDIFHDPPKDTAVKHSAKRREDYDLGSVLESGLTLSETGKEEKITTTASEEIKITLFKANSCKASTAAKGKSIQAACSNDSVMSNPENKADQNLSFPARPTRSSLSLSFSGLTGESSGGDYQDCGVSSMLHMGEPPWYPPGPESSFPQASRDSAVMRYKEKKKMRKFEKKIRYESRKARADVRRRVKGRFVKAGEAYDYDPMCQTRSY